jgi:hypothetical protein
MYNNLGWIHHRLASAAHLVTDYYEKALQMGKAISDERKIKVSNDYNFK